MSDLSVALRVPLRSFSDLFGPETMRTVSSFQLGADFLTKYEDLLPQLSAFRGQYSHI